MTTLETIYTVTEDTNDDGGLYYTVRDAQGDDVYDCDRRRDAEVEAGERNINAAIEDAIGGLENLLESLTESRSLTTLKAIRAMIETAENLE
jgi:hypothetical protein